MKKSSISWVLIILSFFFCTNYIFAQQRADSNDLSSVVKELEKQNNELRFQLRLLDNNMKKSQDVHSQIIDSILSILQETQGRMHQTSDTLTKTYKELTSVKTRSEAQGEWFGSNIAKNRTQMLLAFIILMIISTLIYYLLNKGLRNNAINMQNRFQGAYEDFDDSIKSATALLNKHIKETRESLDKEVKHTHSLLEGEIVNTREEMSGQINETSRIMDVKIEENKSKLDQYASETKVRLADEINNTSKDFERQLKDAKDFLIDTIDSKYTQLKTESTQRARALEDSIVELKSDLETLRSNQKES